MTNSLQFACYKTRLGKNVDKFFFYKSLTYNNMKDKLIILKHYLICALWTEELDSREIEEIHPKSLEQAKKDVDSFVKKAGSLLDDMDEEQIGHDFWLSRNHHGAGFFDRGLGEVGDKLQKLSQTFKELNVFDDVNVIIE